MSEIDLAVAKRRLHVIHDADDADIQQALDSAEREACRYINRDRLPRTGDPWPTCPEDPLPPPSSSATVEDDVVDAVLLLVKASYEATTPAEVLGYRDAAQIKLDPYRVGLGV